MQIIHGNYQNNRQLNMILYYIYLRFHLMIDRIVVLSLFDKTVEISKVEHKKVCMVFIVQWCYLQLVAFDLVFLFSNFKPRFLFLSIFQNN